MDLREEIKAVCLAEPMDTLRANLRKEIKYPGDRRKSWRAPREPISVGELIECLRKCDPNDKVFVILDDDLVRACRYVEKVSGQVELSEWGS